MDEEIEEKTTVETLRYVIKSLNEQIENLNGLVASLRRDNSKLLNLLEISMETERS